jgi:hypothetical protein
VRLSQLFFSSIETCYTLLVKKQPIAKPTNDLNLKFYPGFSPTTQQQQQIAQEKPRMASA